MDDGSLRRVAETKRHFWLVDFFRRLVKERALGTVGGTITLFLLLTGIFADFIAPYGMNESHGVENFLAPPSARFWLGADNVGRDVLSRVIFGARTSVIIGLASSTVATTLAVIIGIVSGYSGGKFDLIIQRFIDLLMSFPGLIFMMVLVTVIGPGMWEVILVLGLRWGILGSRVIRSTVIGVKENAYVSAALAIGSSTYRILMRHILPNITAPLIILFTTRVPAFIITEASLSFLGFGVPPPTPSWGEMLSGSGRDYMYRAPWMVIWPGLALTIVVYGINMFGDAVRDIVDPRLRGGAGRYGSRVKKEAAVKKLS